MNFYSLDGLKSNELFQNNNPIYENFANVMSSNVLTSSTHGLLNNNELFAGVPTTSSTATDSDFQCSDNYAIDGTTIEQKEQSSVNACKKACYEAGTNCVGFNYDTSNNTCTLKQNASSLNNTAPSNTLCVKKNAGDKHCKTTHNSTSNSTSNESPFDKLNAIFATNSSENTYNESQTNQENQKQQGNKKNKKNQKGQETKTEIETNLSQYPMGIPKPENMINGEIQPEVETNQEKLQKNKQEMNMNERPGVFVDLDCFMNNMQSLQNHSPNMMIDLSLLLSNIKSCSYVKKIHPNQNQNKNIKTEKNSSELLPTEILNQLTSQIQLPEPELVKLKNIQANLLVSQGSNSSGVGQLVGISKEPFATEELEKPRTIPQTLSDWFSNDYFKVFILVIILLLVIFRKQL